jgi:hypothetical protein
VFPNDFALANLWIDTTDFKLTDRQSIKGNTDFYSHKEGAPALRYRILFDARGVARKIFRPTGGGIHEANFVRLTADWFEEHLKGAVIIGDSHFSTAAKLFHDPKVLTPVNPKEKEQKCKASEDPDLELLEVKTKTKQKYSDDGHKVRGRVESPFGLIKSKFKALDQKRHGEEEQQTCLIYYAVAILNISKTHMH